MPSNTYAYGCACVYNRNNSAISIILIPPVKKVSFAINTYTTTWDGWKIYTTNDNFGYIECVVNTQADVPVKIDNAPSSRYGYIPVIISHISTNLVQDTIYFDVNNWWITSTTSQKISIVFYKIPY